MVLILAVVFGRYELTEAVEHTEECTQALVAPMKHGLLVHVKRKQKQ